PLSITRKKVWRSHWWEYLSRQLPPCAPSTDGITCGPCSVSRNSWSPRPTGNGGAGSATARTLQTIQPLQGARRQQTVFYQKSNVSGKMRPQNSSQRSRPAAWCMKSHLAIYFQLSDNCLYCQSSLTSTILSHIGRAAFRQATRISSPM